MKTFRPTALTNPSVRQHLANAISYAKEVLTLQEDPKTQDYRPDLLGELGIAEHLLEGSPNSAEILNEVLKLRRHLEEVKCVPSPDTITWMRQLWTKIDASVPEQRSPVHLPPRTAPSIARTLFSFPSGLETRSPIDILILDGNSEEELKGIRTMIDNNVTGVGTVYEGTLPEQAAEYVLVWPAHTGIIRKMDAGIVYPIFAKTAGNRPDWTCKPQVVTKEAWLKTCDLNKAMENIEPKYESRMSPFVDLSTEIKTICCGAKGRLRAGAYFIRWIPANWALITESLTAQLRWPGMKE